MGAEKKEARQRKNSQASYLKRLVKQEYIAVGIGIALLIVFAIFNIALSRMQNVQLNATIALDQYRIGSKTLTAAVRCYAVTGEQRYVDDYNKEINEDKNRDKAVEILKKCGLTEEEWASMDYVAELSNSLVPLEEQAIEAAGKGDMEAAQGYIFTEEYAQSVDEINAKTDQTIQEIRDRKSNQQNILQMIQIAFDILLLLSFAYIVWQIVKTLRFTSNELLDPIIKVSEQMTSLAGGDFSVPLDLKEDDSEVGVMVEAIAFMKKNMHSMVGEISRILEQMGNGNYNVKVEEQYVGEFIQIKDSLQIIGEKMRETLMTLREVSGQIDSGSEQLAYAAEDLAEGSTNQAGQVSELTVVFEQMMESMEHNVVEAMESVETAMQAGQTLAQGNEKMKRLKQAIGEISECYEQISTIIGTIEDIASQTNLLSLNAAIEAARAGEAGKGFAVVAEQVKNLAEESAKAAGQTTKLIETAVASVESGITVADETAESIDLVMESAMAATKKMGRISEILQRDVEHMHQLKENLDRVSAVVDNNSATSEETAAVSEQQKAQVETMVQLMEKFQI